MNLKGIGMSLYAHFSILLSGGLVYLLCLGSGNRSDALTGAAYITLFAYPIMMGLMVWGTKRAHWVGPRMQQMVNSMIVRVILAATILFGMAARHSKSNEWVFASAYAASAILAVAWLFSAAYDGATKYDIRKVKPISVNLALSGVVGKSIIALSVFPMLVFTFHFLFILPFMLGATLIGSARGGDALNAISLIAYLPAIYSALQLCRRIWNQPTT